MTAFKVDREKDLPVVLRWHTPYYADSLCCRQFKEASCVVFNRPIEVDRHDLIYHEEIVADASNGLMPR